MLAYSPKAQLFAFAPQVTKTSTACNIHIYNTITSTTASFALPASLVDAATKSSYKPTVVATDAEESDDENSNAGDPRNVHSPFAVSCLAFDHTGQYLCVTTDNSMLYVYDVTKSELVAYKSISRRPTIVTYSPDNRFILFADRIGDIYALNSEKFISGESTTEHLLFSVGTVVTTLRFTEVDGKQYMICGDQENKIRVSNYPNFFDIQSMCMGQASIVSALEVIPTADSVLLFSASTVPPVNTIENADGSSTPYSIPFGETQHCVWNIITGTRTANKNQHVVTSTVNETLEDSERDAQLTYFSSSVVINNNVVLLAPATVTCGRISSHTSYVKQATNVGAELHHLIAVSPTTTDMKTLKVVIEGQDLLAGRKVVTIVAGDNTLACVLEDNTVAFVKIALENDTLTLTVSKVETFESSTLTETPYPTYMVDVHTRLIEAFYKQEFFISSNAARKAKKAKTSK